MQKFLMLFFLLYSLPAWAATPIRCTDGCEFYDGSTLLQSIDTSGNTLIQGDLTTGELALSVQSGSAQMSFGRTTTAEGWGYLGANSSEAFILWSGGTGSSPVLGNRLIEVAQSGDVDFNYNVNVDSGLSVQSVESSKIPNTSNGYSIRSSTVIGQELNIQSDDEAGLTFWRKTLSDNDGLAFWRIWTDTGGSGFTRDLHFDAYFPDGFNPGSTPVRVANFRQDNVVELTGNLSFDGDTNYIGTTTSTDTLQFSQDYFRRKQKFFIEGTYGSIGFNLSGFSLRQHIDVSGMSILSSINPDIQVNSGSGSIRIAVFAGDKNNPNSASFIAYSNGITTAAGEREAYHFTFPPIQINPSLDYSFEFDFSSYTFGDVSFPGLSDYSNYTSFPLYTKSGASTYILRTNQRINYSLYGYEDTVRDSVRVNDDVYFNDSQNLTASNLYIGDSGKPLTYYNFFASYPAKGIDPNPSSSGFTLDSTYDDYSVQRIGDFCYTRFRFSLIIGGSSVGTAVLNFLNLPDWAYPKPGGEIMFYFPTRNSIDNNRGQSLGLFNYSGELEVFYRYEGTGQTNFPASSTVHTGINVSRMGASNYNWVAMPPYQCGN